MERLAQSLKEGEVDYILVDMYLPVKRRDLFNGSWFEIAALFETEVFHGVILQGDALKLASTLEEMIANSNVQTKFLTDTEEVIYSFIFVVCYRSSTPDRVIELCCCVRHITLTVSLSAIWVLVICYGNLTNCKRLGD